MKTTMKTAAIALGFAGAVVMSAPAMAVTDAGAQGQQQTQQQAEGQMPLSEELQQHVQGWPEASQEAARAMVGKYGEPDERTGNMLVWKDNGPWKETIVYGEATDHNFPMPHKDVLEQTINYEVPVDKFDDLAEYDGSVTARRTEAELSAKCDKEGANILALNLADDIVKGRKTVEEARDTFAQTIQEFSRTSQTQPLMQELHFDVIKQDLANSDEAVISPEKSAQQ